MGETTPPLPQYVFMAWCFVKHREIFNLYIYAGELAGQEMIKVKLRVLMCLPKYHAMRPYWRMECGSPHSYSKY
jgi:hypothetical protein